MAGSSYNIDNYKVLHHPKRDVDESLLVESFNNNNQASFTAIYNRLFPSVFYFAKRFVGHEEALDRTAETFLKLWRMEKSFASGQSIKHWCQVTVRNDCYNFLRTQKLRLSKSNQIADSTEIMIAPQEDIIIETELMVLVLHEIEQLPPQCKKIFKLAYFDQLPEKQIVARLGLSANTIRNQKARALKLLRFSLSRSLFLFIFFAKNFHSFW